MQLKYVPIDVAAFISMLFSNLFDESENAKEHRGEKNKMLAMCTTNVNFHVFYIELIYFLKKGNYWK
jgi:hypothetical protein